MLFVRCEQVLTFPGSVDPCNTREACIVFCSKLGQRLSTSSEKSRSLGSWQLDTKTACSQPCWELPLLQVQTPSCLLGLWGYAFPTEMRIMNVCPFIPPFTYMSGNMRLFLKSRAGGSVILLRNFISGEPGRLSQS